MRKKTSKKSSVKSSGETANKERVPSSSRSKTFLIPQEHQQRLLDLLSHALNETLSDPSFPGLLQEIKKALYNRDFAAAFAKEEHLRVYAARWSPTRALCYATVLSGINHYLEELYLEQDAQEEMYLEQDAQEEIYLEQDAQEQVENEQLTAQNQDNVKVNPAIQESSTSQHTIQPSPIVKKTFKMLAIGGCVAENLAFASHICLHASLSSGKLTLLDSGPWESIVALVQEAILSPPQPSSCASSAAKAPNAATILSPHQALQTVFAQQDVLSLTLPALKSVIGPDRLLVTLMFTLNELYTNAGVGPTTRFLKNLGHALPDGSLLLVVDSPGSYSEAEIGKEKQQGGKRKYPMQWLLHHTLTGTEHAGYSWERLESEESLWFRLVDGLRYPIQLENMRYQMHLYKLAIEE